MFYYHYWFQKKKEVNYFSESEYNFARNLIEGRRHEDMEKRTLQNKVDTVDDFRLLNICFCPV